MFEFGAKPVIWSVETENRRREIVLAEMLKQVEKHVLPQDEVEKERVQ